MGPAEARRLHVSVIVAEGYVGPSSLCRWLQDLRSLSFCRASFGAFVEPALSATTALAGRRVVVSLLAHGADLRRIGLLLDHDVGQHLG